MPLQNRVTPRSELIAVAARGTLMGNRGVLHDAQGRIGQHRWRTQAWVTCRLAFKGRHRAVMTPGRYTELFFLDEATALAAGHRPCGECRRSDFLRFKALARTAMDLAVGAPIGALDRRLHTERTRRGPLGETHYASLGTLPDGVIVVLDGSPTGAPWLVLGSTVLRWSPGGYTQRQERPDAMEVAVLTPPCTVGALAAGYRPMLHASALTSP